MAGKGSNLLTKVLSKLKQFFARIPSMYADFDVMGSEGTIENGNYIWRQTLTSNKFKDTTGSPLQMRISIAATNVKDIPLVAQFNKALQDAASVGHYTFTDAGIQITGIGPVVGKTPIEEYNNSKDPNDPNSYGDPMLITTENAQQGSLLNPNDLNEGTTTLNDSWTKVADSLTFDIMCECVGYPSGKKSGQSWDQITELIREFPLLCGAITNDMMPTDLKDGNGILMNNVTPIVAILKQIQENIGATLDATSKSFAGIDDDNEPNPDENAEPADENAPEASNADNPAENTEPTEGEQQPNMQSKKINMKLQKITGATDVSLMAIKANFNPGEALDVVDDVLASPEFLDLITETPQSYEVLVDDEGYDVNPCTDLIVDPNENLTQLFIQANQFSRNLHMIHWLSIGNDMEKLHIKAEELYGELDQEIDLLAELIVEKTGTIIDINKIETWNTVGTQDKTFQQGIECIKQDAQSFIDYIDITYPNQPSDVQSVLDDWLRYWNKQLNYFIVREQE